jgi:hypothetical protein
MRKVLKIGRRNFTFAAIITDTRNCFKLFPERAGNKNSSRLTERGLFLFYDEPGGVIAAQKNQPDFV